MTINDHDDWLCWDSTVALPYRSVTKRPKQRPVFVSNPCWKQRTAGGSQPKVVFLPPLTVNLLIRRMRRVSTPTAFWTQQPFQVAIDWIELRLICQRHSASFPLPPPPRWGSRGLAINPYRFLATVLFKTADRVVRSSVALICSSTHLPTDDERTSSERDDYLYLALKQTDSPTNRGVQFAFKISKSHVVRISNELSHFATFFLAWQAEVSIVISCVCFMFQFRDLTIVFFKVLKVIDVRCLFNMLDDDEQCNQPTTTIVIVCSFV